MSRVLVALAALLSLGVVATGTPAVPATLQPTGLTTTFSTTTPAYNQPVTVTGTVSPWGAPTGGGRTLYLRTYMNGSWINVRSMQLTGSSYTFSYQTTWLGTRKYQVWTPNTSKQAGAWSQQVTVTHHKFASSTTASLSPSPTTVGTTVVMKGRVSTNGTQADRTVTLYRVFPNGRHAERTTRTATDGTWSFSLPHWFLTNRDVQAYVAATPSTAEVSSARLRQTMKPTYTPGGTASMHGWTRDSGGYRWHWNGCRKEITWRINPDGLGTGFIDDTTAVIRRVQQATGIRFRYLGTTRAYVGGTQAWPSDAQVVISAGTQADTSWDMSGDVLARGGGINGYGYWARDYDGKIVETTRGGVFFEKGHGYTAGFNGALSRGQVLMHEMGHVMGLGHVGSDTQTMYPTAHDQPRYGAGDLWGLQRAGYGLGGCTTRITGRYGKPLVVSGDAPNLD